MRPKICKLLLVSLLLAYIFTSALFHQTIATPATPKISVEPASNVFGTDTTSVGDSFTVDIVTSGWEDPGLFSYECKLFYDTALLDVVEAAYPAGHFLPAPNFEVPVDIKEESGYILFGVTKLGDVPGSTGAGTLSTITFEITAAPPPVLSCDLELKDIVLLDPQGAEVLEYEVEHGYYEFSPPKPPVYLKVEPEVVGAFEVGEQVMIDITINDIRAVDRLIGVEWKVAYDTTFLQLSNVTEGAFMKHFAELSGVEPPYTIFDWHEDVGVVFIFILPSADEPYPGPFPEGSGILATMIFTAISMPEEAAETPLELFDIVLLDADGNELLYVHLDDNNGKYIAPVEPGDLNIDGEINIQDLYIFGSSFGSYPEHPRWDARADLNRDNKVNMLDGVIIAISFHT